MAPWFSVSFPNATATILEAVRTTGENIAAVILVRKPVTVEQLKSNYNMAALEGNKKVRILIVPGHEPDFGGTEYGLLKERDLNVEVAENLKNYLSQNLRYEVRMTRTKNSWIPEIAEYFKLNWTEIIEWQKANKDALKELVKIGGYTPVVQLVYHNTVNPSVGTRLHGINKWANENEMDVVVHIHFNDYPRKNTSTSGNYTGFAIYVPEGQYFNSTSTKAVANTVFKRLAKYNPVSDLRGERSGIVEEPDLIAIGSYNSVDAASMLIEYAYIYEPQLNDSRIRETYLKDIAYETYLGLQDFFDPVTLPIGMNNLGTMVLPYKWQNQLIGKNDLPQDVFALQTAMILDGVYPPAGLSPNECPRTGKFGACTRAALKAFQQKYDIKDEKDIVGLNTISTLNRVYSNGAL